MAHDLTEIIEILTNLIGDWELEFFKACEAEGFTARQVEYIDTINRLGNPNLGEIARELKLSKPSVTVAMEKLVSKGYVQKIRSDEDRRAYHVHLSAKGRKLVEMHALTHKKIADLFRSTLNGQDLKALVALLNKVVSKT